MASLHNYLPNVTMSVEERKEVSNGGSNGGRNRKDRRVNIEERKRKGKKEGTGEKGKKEGLAEYGDL